MTLPPISIPLSEKLGHHRETLDDRQGRGTGSRIVVMASVACENLFEMDLDHRGKMGEMDLGGMGMIGKDAVCVQVVCR